MEKECTLKQGIIYLFCTIHQEKDKYLGYVLSDREADATLAALQKFLKDREYQVISYRFGFYDGKQYCLEEVGRKMSITRERVRQLEAQAIRKLRRSLLFGEAVIRPVGPDEIDQLGLTIGTLNYLKRNGIHSISDISKMSEEDWKDECCKEAYLKEVKEKVLS